MPFAARLLRALSRTLLPLALALAVPAAQAQSFPTKPVTLVAPFAAGGTSDAIARATARLMEADLGQPVVVVNRPGAGGTIDIALADLTLIRPALQGGRARPLAIAGEERSPLLPGVPTTAELGWPAVRMDTWYALFAPAATPAPIVERLRAALDKARANPELAAVLQAQGVTPLRAPVKAFEEQLRRDFQTWPPLLTRICSQNSCD
ncbi:MAG TPA: tripartite tricarboxylate transporter substrate-binding protein [Ramlibacter sp.]|nr:tripartite tricarboxylate transporter substrate-binding protein [Ramlibacter sp.]